MFLLAAATLLFQQPQPSPVARIRVTPANPIVVAGDTVRLRGEALDSAGQPVPGATIRFFGGSFEGTVDSANVLHGGARGMVTVRAVATVPGRATSRPQTINAQVISPPASRISLSPAVPRALAGQRLKLSADVYAAN